MKYTIYLDGWIVYLFGMNMIILMILEVLFQCTASIWKKIAGSLWVATVTMLLTLIPIPLGFGKQMLISLVLPFALIQFTFPWLQIQKKITMGTVSILMVFFCGSVWQCMGLHQLLNFSSLQIKTIVMGCFMGYLFLRILIHHKNRGNNVHEKPIYQGTFFHGQSMLPTKLLMDSGNLLRFGENGYPVVILEERLVKKLFEDHTQLHNQKSFDIPFCTLGTAEENLKGMIIDRLQINYDGITKEYCDVMVGLHKGMISKTSEYYGILPTFQNLKVYERMGKKVENGYGRKSNAGCK